MATKLEGGHTQSVLSATAAVDGKIISGGENGELCIWTQEGARVLQTNLENGDDVTSLCCSKHKPEVLFVAAGQKINFFDIRQFTSPFESHEFNEEEINCLALNEKEDFLAACDDAGQVKVINMQDRKVFKTLKKHTNICSSVCFRPRRPWDLLSGGFDSNFIQWDFSRGRSVCVIDMQTITIEDEQPSAYLVNPPFIHSIDLTSDGNYIATGLENALIHVFKGNQRHPEFMATLHGHTQGVSQVHFPKFQEKLLITGGNDGRLLLWDVGEMAERRVLQNGAANGNGDAHSNQNGHQNGHDGDHGAAAESVPKQVIEHGAKINWLTSSSSNNNKVIIVADNTNDLTVYPIPQ